MILIKLQEFSTFSPSEKTKIRKIFLTGILLFTIGFSLAQTTFPDTTLQNQKNIYRDYTFVFAPEYDLYNSSINARTAGKMLHDVFSRGIGPQIKNETVRNVTEGIWSFAVTFSSMLGAHEFGHFLRARQVEGNFYMERFSFPVIYGRMELPPNHTLEDNALAVAGGFEANYMTVKDIQLDLYKYHTLYNDELGVSFAHRMLFPIYFSTIASVNPELPETWVNTMGDPIHWIKPIWERSGREVIQPDNTVNPDLVRFYKQATLLSFLWNFADLNFYRELGSLFGNSLEGKSAKYILGDATTGWGYGTLFNTSVIGAELHLTNYLQLNKKLFTLNLRTGFPFTNYGIGVGAHQIFDQSNKFNMDVVLDMWNQEYYENGFALTTTNQYRIGNRFDALLQIGYKTDGYLLGRIMRNGLFGNVGLRYALPQVRN